MLYFIIGQLLLLLAKVAKYWNVCSCFCVRCRVMLKRQPSTCWTSVWEDLCPPRFLFKRSTMNSFLDYFFFKSSSLWFNLNSSILLEKPVKWCVWWVFCFVLHIKWRISLGRDTGIGELCPRFLWIFNNAPLCFSHLSLLFHVTYLRGKLKN